MRPDRAFRPAISDWSLEDRVVLSLAATGAQLSALLGQSIPLPTSVQANPAVQAAFATFATRYDAAVTSVLFAPGADGTVNPAANLPAFEAQVEADLQSLDQALISALASSTQTASLVPTVQQAIFGSGANSFQSQLNALAASLSGAANSVPVFAMSSAQAIQEASGRIAILTQSTGRPLVAQGGPTSTPDTPGGLRLSALNLASPRMKQAFDLFAETYFSAVNNTLMAPGGNAQANREAFNAQVAAALDRLDADIARILTDLRESAPQNQQVHQALVGNDPQSLKSRLAALPTPVQGTGTSLPILQDLSTRLITDSLEQASSALSVLVPGLK
jgi:hypothetical protein